MPRRPALNASHPIYRLFELPDTRWRRRTLRIVDDRLGDAPRAVVEHHHLGLLGLGTDAAIAGAVEKPHGVDLRDERTELPGRDGASLDADGSDVSAPLVDNRSV